MKKNIITKVKSNKKDYLICVNEESYLIDSYFYECFLPYEGKKLDDNQLDLLESFSKAKITISKLYNKIFANRLSVYEVKSKLQKASIAEKQINLIVDFLKKEGHLNDIEVIKYYQEIYQNTKGYKAFRSYLINKHISSFLIDKYANNYLENYDYALAYAQKYIDTKVASIAMKKNLILAKLVNKGFSKETIDQVLKALDFKDDDLSLLKELKKYSLKYPNDKYKVISKLVQKGYNINAILKTIQEEGMFDEN